MQDNNILNNDTNDELITLTKLIYQETEKTIISRECERILTELLTEEVFNTEYPKDDKVKKI